MCVCVSCNDAHWLCVIVSAHRREQHTGQFHVVLKVKGY